MVNFGGVDVENDLVAGNRRAGWSDNAGEGWFKAIEAQSDALIKDAEERLRRDAKYGFDIGNESRYGIGDDAYATEMALNRPNEDSPRKFNVSATLASQLERQLDDYGYGPETSESSAKDIVRNWALVE